jgi:hypothetical protein
MGGGEKWDEISSPLPLIKPDPSRWTVHLTSVTYEQVIRILSDCIHGLRSLQIFLQDLLPEASDNA